MRAKRVRKPRTRGSQVPSCFLAYALWKTLEPWQARADLGRSPRASTDIVLPTQNGRELRLRCIVRPDGAQSALLGRLGVDLPERLRIPSPLLETTSV